MAGIKISALPAVPSALITDYLPVVQGGVTSRETLQQISTLFGFDSVTGLLALNKGGTNASLTAALGAVPYSTASAFAFLAPGSTGQLFRSGGAGAPTWTTSTYPATNAVSTLLYASSANVMAALPTAASGALVTSAGGVPSISTVLPGGMTTTDPTLTQGIATKNYVDQTALNGTSVYAATTTNLTVTQSGAGVGATLTNAGAQATFSIDGVNPPVGSNVLVKNLATAANEGIYTVTSVGSGATNWVLTRATTYDTPTEINMTGLILVNNGSTLAGTAWYNAATIVTVDTTAFSYSQFGNIIFPITLANGGTSASLTASNGGIFYSTASAGAILAGTATAGQIIRSGASSAPSWSTTTYPNTVTSGSILYGSSANVVGEQTYSQLAVNASLVKTVKSQVFTSSGTYTPSTGMLYCIAQTVGGGGGGGGAGTSGAGQASVGACGAGGGYARKVFTAATIGASQAVTVGAAGAAGAAAAGAGGSGGTTSLGALLVATGGGGGPGAPGSALQATSGGSPGIGSGGDFNTAGTPGGGSFNSALLVYAGNGGSSFFGGGANGLFTIGAGNAANSYGGGGSGGVTANSAQQAGGAGFAGIVIITEFCNQ